MTERPKERFSPPTLGGTSLLTVFAVLCLTIFALLSLATVQADRRLGDVSAQTVADYYAADCKAQETLARLRNGETPEGVTSADGVFRYTCPISDIQVLEVEVQVDGGEYTILRWQAKPTGDWNADEQLQVWDGEDF